MHCCMCLPVRGYYPDNHGLCVFHLSPVSLCVCVCMRETGCVLGDEMAFRQPRLAFQVLSDEVVSKPVHEDGLYCCYRHGEVHPQLVSGSPHQPALCRRLR